MASNNHRRSAHERHGATGLGGEALERADRLILRELQRDGAISNATLGERAAVSESAAARHRHWLEREGYIKRYAAVVDVERLGYSQTALVEVGLASQHDDALAAFERSVAEVAEVLAVHAVIESNALSVVNLDAEVAEVLAVHAVAGQLDYLLHVVARDTHDMERVQHQLTALPGVEHLHTHVVLKDVLNREVVDPA